MSAMYVPFGVPVPYTHFAEREIQVPSIDPAAVREWLADPPIGVTMCSTPGNFREFIPGDVVTVVLKSGARLRVPHDALGLALAGGGRCSIAYPNPEYNQPITRERAEEIEDEREREELEAAAWDW